MQTEPASAANSGSLNLPGNALRSTIGVFGIVCFGVAAALIVNLAGDLPGVVRPLGIAAALILVLVVAALTRQFRRTMIFAWVVSQGYFRTFSLTGDLVPLTTFDFYVTVSDVFLLVLTVIAIWQRVFLKIRPPSGGSRLWLWALPFWLAAVVSIANAARFDWAFFEVFRLAKLVLMLMLMRELIRDSFDWWLTVAAMGSAACLQCFYGFFQLATGTATVLDGESSARAMGTLGHPNTFSSFLAAIWPVFGMLTIAAARGSRLRWLSGAVSIVILAGIGVAQSRAVWLVAIGQALLLVGGSIGLGLVPLKRALGTAIAVAAAVVILLLPLAGRIEERIVSNWSDSADYRTRYDAIALEMYADRPWIGGGPRQFPLRFKAHARELYGDYADKVPLYPVHNFYLLELTEYGIFGFLALAAFLASVLACGLRSFRNPDRLRRAAGYGLTVGIVGMLVHQLSELVLVLDPDLYIFGLIAFLLSAIAIDLNLRVPEALTRRRDRPAALPSGQVVRL